jgi:hypothetical protein
MEEENAETLDSVVDDQGPNEDGNVSPPYSSI